MSEPETKAETDADLTTNEPVPSTENGAEAISKMGGLSSVVEFAGGEKEQQEVNNKNLKMEVGAVDEGKKQEEEKKDVDVKMTEAGASNNTHGEDSKMTEADNLSKEESEDITKEEEEDAKKEVAVDSNDEKSVDKTKEEEYAGKEVAEVDTNNEKTSNNTNEEARDKITSEAEGAKTAEAVISKLEVVVSAEKVEAATTNMEETGCKKTENSIDKKEEKIIDVKEEEAKGTGQEEVKESKEETTKDTKEEEAKDRIKEECKDTKLEEVDTVQDVEMEDREVEDRQLEEDRITDKENGNVENAEASEEALGEGSNKKPIRSKKESRKRKASRSKKKQTKEQKVSEDGNTKEIKKRERKVKEVSTPVGSSIERPIRARKSVERLVEALERESVKPFIIEKGRGTPLKDIPNVAYKIAKKKPADLKLLHQTLFGRVGKAIDYKNHILQFSGFAWHESEDKQKTKVKEKLDKYVKDSLLDFCDLFDIPISKGRSNARKEELVAMILDFMVAPHPMTDVILSEKEQSKKSTKRKRGPDNSGSKSSGGLLGKRSRKENIKNTDIPKDKGKSAHETEDEDEDEDEDDNKNDVLAEDDSPENSESKGKNAGSEEEAEGSKDDDSRKGKPKMMSPKRGGSSGTKKSEVSASPKKISPPKSAKSPKKSLSSTSSNAGNKTNGRTKLFLGKHEDSKTPVKKAVSSKTDPKERTSGKRVAKSKNKPKSEESGPSMEELRKTVCEILTRVDFNTATFTDILKELASHYGIDFTPRKSPIKVMIQEELTKLAEEDEDEEEDNEDADDDKEDGTRN